MRNLELRFPFSFDIVAYISLIDSVNILLSCNKVIITGESVLLMMGVDSGVSLSPPLPPYLPPPAPRLPPPFWSGARFACAKFSSFPPPSLFSSPLPPPALFSLLPPHFSLLPPLSSLPLLSPLPPPHLPLPLTRSAPSLIFLHLHLRNSTMNITFRD